MPPITRVDHRPLPSTVTTAPTTTTTPVTSTPTPAPGATGLDAATGSGTAPSSLGTVLGGGAAAAGLARLSAAAFQGSSTGLYALVPGRYPDAIGLDVVLKGLAGSPQGQAAVKQLIARFEAMFGVPVNPALASAAIANPERLTDIFKLTPQQMSAGFDAQNLAFRNGQLPATAPKQRFLPKTFDFAKLDAVAYSRPQGEVKEIAPGLLRGDVKNVNLSDAQAKTNAALAEVLDRLSENATLPAKDRFAVRYNGHELTRVNTFLDALKKDGYEISATVGHRVANFAALLAKAPSGELLDVPAPVFVTADDGRGNSVPLPSNHSELIFNIKSGPTTQGPKLDGDVKWYQGVSTTGFFAANLMRAPTWCGKGVSDSFQGADATRALELAALLSDTINSAAGKAGLAANGYGVTGVCNDSVSIIQQAVSGRLTEYPLMMRDATLLPEIEARIAAPGTRDEPHLRALRKAIGEVPSDVTPNDTQVARALSSIPWEAGQEPFASSEAARAVLKAALP